MSYTKSHIIDATDGGDTVKQAVIKNDDNIDDLFTAMNIEQAATVLNTAKTGITPGQASAITANTAKISNATHTGDVTGATALTIGNDKVTYAKMQNIPTANLLGRVSASTG